MLEWIGDLAEFLLGLGDGILGYGRHEHKSTEAQFMSVVEIESLPDSSRTWVFGSDRTLDAAQTKGLLAAVDPFLQQWKAHGNELTVARDWKFGRFLTIAVDQSTAGASGCSIDGLYRELKSLQPKLGASLVNSGLIFYRDENGAVQSVDRDQFAALGAEGKVGPHTRVFDPTVTSLAEWRARFVLDLKDSWHAKLVKQNQPA
jgi:hypothetical protein